MTGHLIVLEVAKQLACEARANAIRDLIKMQRQCALKARAAARLTIGIL